MRTAVMIVTWVGLLIGCGVGRAGEPVSALPRWSAVEAIEASYEAVGGDSLGLKSPSKAATLSLFGTLVPFVVGSRAGNTDGSVAEIGRAAAAVGVFIGPSLGYFYGGCDRRGVTGISIRAGLMVVGAIAASRAEWPGISWGDDESEKGNAAAGITVLALTGVIVDMVIDLIQVSGTVHRENERRVHQPPAARPTFGALSGSTTPAFGLTVNF